MFIWKTLTVVFAILGAVDLSSVAFATKSPLLEYLRGRFCFLEGNFDEALRHYKRALREDPFSSFLRFEIAVVLLNLERKEEAKRFLSEAITYNPRNAEALRLLGDICMAEGDLQGAIRAYGRLIEAIPDEIQPYFTLSSLHLQAGEYDKAVEVLQKLLLRRPESALAHYYLARVYVEGQRYGEGLVHYRKAMELDPSLSSKIFPEMALVYELLGDIENALKLYNDLLEDNPIDIETRERLAYLLLRQKRYEEAQKELETIKRIDPNNATAMVNLGLLHMEKGDFEKAKAEFELALVVRPNDHKARLYLAASLIEMSRFAEGVQEFKKIDPESEIFLDGMKYVVTLLLKKGEGKRALQLIEENPMGKGDQELIYLEALLLEEEGELIKAMEKLEKLVSQDPQKTHYLFRLGVIYHKLGKREESLRMMEEVIRLDPNHAEALNWVGYSYAEKGIKLDEAEKLIRRALELKPDDGYIIDSMGWVYFQKGLYEQALSYLERAHELLPNDPVVTEHLADVYLKLNQSEKAIELYKKALELVTDDQDKERIMEKLRETSDEKKRTVHNL